MPYIHQIETLFERGLEMTEEPDLPGDCCRGFAREGLPICFKCSDYLAWRRVDDFRSAFGEQELDNVRTGRKTIAQVMYEWRV